MSFAVGVMVGVSIGFFLVAITLRLGLLGEHAVFRCHDCDLCYRDDAEMTPFEPARLGCCARCRERHKQNDEWLERMREHGD